MTFHTERGFDLIPFRFLPFSKGRREATTTINIIIIITIIRPSNNNINFWPRKEEVLTIQPKKSKSTDSPVHWFHRFPSFLKLEGFPIEDNNSTISILPLALEFWGGRVRLSYYPGFHNKSPCQRNGQSRVQISRDDWVVVVVFSILVGDFLKDLCSTNWHVNVLS